MRYELPVMVLVPKLSPKQQAELYRMYDSGNYSIADLAELFSVSRRHRVPLPPAAASTDQLIHPSRRS